MSGMKDLFGDQYYEQRKPPSSDLGHALKEQGLELVKVNSGDWFGRALMVIVSVEKGWIGIAEDLRFLIVERIGRPHTDKVWGSLISQAIKHHLLARTGRRLKMRDPNSHARLTDEYRRV